MLFGTSIPISQDKLERFHRLQAELEEHRVEYEALNARFGVRAHSVWLSTQRDGTPIAGNIYDIDPAGLAHMAQRTWDMGSAYDRWWVDWVADVYGVDLLAGSAYGAPPRKILEWDG